MKLNDIVLDKGALVNIIIYVKCLKAVLDDYRLDHSSDQRRLLYVTTTATTITAASMSTTPSSSSASST